MLFNSLTFVLFFSVIVMVHYSPLAWRYKKTSLLAGSYLFYAAWNPPFVLLLLLSTLVDWHLAQKIHSSSSNSRRKKWLWLSLSFNLGLLVLFKYSGFLLENFQALLSLFNIAVAFKDPGFILPMGISFYTFQTLSYTLDVYFKKLKPHSSFRDYALFVSFFPQLVAGPIVRAKDFLPQLKKQNWISFTAFSLGISLFILGLFEKTVLADAFFAPMVDTVFNSSSAPDQLSSWLAAGFFYAQIFCDFAGYSLCAIGCALCLGFKLPLNFRSPMAAIGFSDFWQRWHISLSSWLRDYLYIPLGGNRLGSFATFRNLMITMLLGGLWHGAAWTFLFWGLLHGLYLVLERGVKQLNFSERLKHSYFTQTLMMALTFLLVMLAFVFFRANSMQQALMIITTMFTSSEGTALLSWKLWTQIVIAAFVGLISLQILFKNKRLTDILSALPIPARALFLSFCLILIAISSGNSDAFIYFQF